MPMQGRTIREAIAIALEGLNGTKEEWLLAHNSEAKQALRKYVRDFMHEYATSRGVILENHDIDAELQRIVTDLRASVRDERELIE